MSPVHGAAETGDRHEPGDERDRACEGPARPPGKVHDSVERPTEQRRSANDGCHDGHEPNAWGEVVEIDLAILGISRHRGRVEAEERGEDEGQSKPED